MFISTLLYTFFVLVLSTLHTAFLLEFCAELLEQTVNCISLCSLITFAWNDSGAI